MQTSKTALLDAISAAPEGEIVAVGMRAPLAPVDALLAALPSRSSAVWSSPSGDAMSAVGVTALVRPTGSARMAALGARAASLFARIRHTQADDRAPPPRLVGGLAFAAEDAPRGPWEEFADGELVLPRWTYVRDADRAHLLFTAVAPSSSHLRRHALRRASLELELVSRTLDTNLTTRTFRAPSAVDHAAMALHVEQEDVASWRVLVEGARTAIASGALAKLVAARVGVVSAAEPFDDLAVLARLADAQPRCFCFGFRRANATFVGASPERLFAKRATALTTHALAGSLDLRDVPEAARDDRIRAHLVDDPKSQREHEVVVREIVASLTPLAREVMVAAGPVAKHVGPIVHLETPITATAWPSTRAADVLAALHPTPAVGGTPRAAAVDWITRNERPSRGWYAGPVGWLDAAGDAEFSVALRCALLMSSEAYVYAGAGIVLDSDADAEYRETAYKQLPMLRALGVVPS